MLVLSGASVGKDIRVVASEASVASCSVDVVASCSVAVVDCSGCCVTGFFWQPVKSRNIDIIRIKGRTLSLLLFFLVKFILFSLYVCLRYLELMIEYLKSHEKACKVHHKAPQIGLLVGKLFSNALQKLIYEKIVGNHKPLGLKNLMPNAVATSQHSAPRYVVM